MRAGLVAIFFFAGILALGHYVAAPFFCRGGIAIPSLDPRTLCGADMHLSRSGSVLLYFASIAAALLFGVIAGVLPSRGKSAFKEKAEVKPVETFEQIVADEEKKQTISTPVAHPSAVPVVASTPNATPAAASPVTPDASTAETKPAPAAAPATGDSAPAASSAAILPAAAPDQKADTSSTPVAETPKPETIAAAEAITVGLTVTKSASRGAFDGTNEELLERFRELKKQEGVNSIAQAQRLLDESTLSALSKGVDPKQHLSQVAHLVLAEDPDLKSGVVRGVVVHVAARLKELGVVNQKFPTQPTKGAA